jgi:hypothetical protein
MSHEDLKRNAAIICKHVSYPERPILYAARGAPVDPADSGWQFLCNLKTRHDFPSAAVWLLEKVAALDPTIRGILDAEPKTCFERSMVDVPWVSTEIFRDVSTPLDMTEGDYPPTAW